MLVPPLIVSRPGENQTPSTGCEILGSTLPADGPYACYIGKNYSRQAIKELAQAVGLLVTEDAQARFEAILLELVAANKTVRARSEENRELAAALEAAKLDLAKAESERDKALDKLSKTRDSASEVRSAVAAILNPKEPVGV